MAWTPIRQLRYFTILNFWQTNYAIALGMPHVRHLEGKLWELRTVFAGNQHRIVFAQVRGGFLPLHAFRKKAQKTLRRCFCQSKS